MTASVLVFLIAILSYLGGVYFLFLICAISLAAGRELYRLLTPRGLSVGREFLMVCILLIIAGAYAGVEYFLIAFYIALTGIFAIHILRGKENISGYLNEVGMCLVFVTLLGIMTGSAVLLRNMDSAMELSGTPAAFVKNETGFFLVAMAFVCASVNDSAAYYIGKWKGSIRIAPRISPGKTFEGGVAGLVAATAAGPLVNMVFGSPLSVPLASFLGLLTGLASTIGDLTESAIKRNSKVKDSGTMLPGHGGFFDRFDGMIFVLPIFYVFALLY